MIDTVKIKMMMKQVEVDQNTLARQCGLTNVTVCHIINNKVDPRLSNVQKIANALGFTLMDIVLPEVQNGN